MTMIIVSHYKILWHENILSVFSNNNKKHKKKLCKIKKFLFLNAVWYFQQKLEIEETKEWSLNTRNQLGHINKPLKLNKPSSSSRSNSEAASHNLKLPRPLTQTITTTLLSSYNFNLFSIQESER